VAAKAIAAIAGTKELAFTDIVLNGKTSPRPLDATGGGNTIRSGYLP
jgi:hypothetical protein